MRSERQVNADEILIRNTGNNNNNTGGNVYVPIEMKTWIILDSDRKKNCHWEAICGAQAQNSNTAVSKHAFIDL